MGSPDGEANRQPDEGPQHVVKVDAFYMGKLEVTWDEYDQFGFKLDLQRKRKLGITPATGRGRRRHAADAAICR